MRRLLVAVLAAAALGAAPADPIDRIREADLKRDLSALAGDAMRGREGGTLDEMTASAWVAERAREAGLQPAGDNGTYFQFFPLERLRVSPGHREGWYYRSDHLPYARAGIPALFFTTLLHPDYHTPFDNPDRIDTAKLTKMTRWMYRPGAVVEADKAPAVDPAFKLERCRDFTGNYCGG